MIFFTKSAGPGIVIKVVNLDIWSVEFFLKISLPVFLPLNYHFPSFRPVVLQIIHFAIGHGPGQEKILIRMTGEGNLKSGEDEVLQD